MLEPEDKMKEIFIAGTQGTIKVKDRDGKVYFISEPKIKWFAYSVIYAQY